MGRNDAELLRRSRNGDADAFGDLVLHYQDRIFATVYRILGNGEDAREMAQEAFFRAWSKLDTFREGARFSTWLYTITLNLTRSELRKRKTRRHVRPVSLSGWSGDDNGRGMEPPSMDEGPLHRIGQAELHRLALAEIDRLDEEAREVVVLRDMQELSYEEIASVLDCPVGTVRSRLHRARGQLRDRLAPLLEASRKGGAPTMPVEEEGGHELRARS
jgi:RNA polymerase sigma-70 factor (ECF subfamily)